MADCPWDLNGDGIVDEADSAWLLDHWGPCTPGSKGDFNGDGLDEIGIFRPSSGLWAIRQPG